MRVLILEDDQKICEFLKKGFQQAGYNSTAVRDGAEGFDLAMHEDFDILIVDIMMPKMNGLQLVSELRRRGIQTPAIFLSAKRETEDKIQGLHCGADDYLTKPFSLSELLARCQAILRRASKPVDTHRLQYRDLELDPLTRAVRRNGEVIQLQQKEFALLEYLLRNQGNVVTKMQILEKVWNYDFDPQTNVVDVLVCRLRNKVDRDQDEKLIKTIRGVGYALRAD